VGKTYIATAKGKEATLNESPAKEILSYIRDLSSPTSSSEIKEDNLAIPNVDEILTSLENYGLISSEEQEEKKPFNLLNYLTK